MRPFLHICLLPSLGCSGFASKQVDTHSSGDTDGDTPDVESGSHTDSLDNETDQDTNSPIDSDSPSPVETDLVGDSDPPSSCSFPSPFVVAPGDEHRSIVVEGAGVLSHTWAQWVDGVNDRKLLALLVDQDPVVRMNEWFVKEPVLGSASYETLIVAAIRATPDVLLPAMMGKSRSDLDGDGDGDVLGRVLDRESGSLACVGYDLAMEERPASQHDWFFVANGAPSANCLIDSIDINADGFDDVMMDWDDPAFGQGHTAYWKLGPIPKGIVDMSDRPAVQIDWPQNWGVMGWNDHGDFNGDGQVDFALIQGGTSRDDGSEIAVFFGPLTGIIDGYSPDILIETSVPSTSFEWSMLRNLGDLDGDGSHELGVGAPGLTVDGLASGGAFIFYGPLPAQAVWTELDADVTISWPHEGASTGDAVVPLGDVDGDHLPEFAVGTFASVARTPPDIDLTIDWPIPVALRDAEIDTAAHDTTPPVAPPTQQPGPPPEGAIMVFSHLPPGHHGPADARFIILGDNPGDAIGTYSIRGPGDLNGDGLADIAYGTVGNPGMTVRVLYPCADFGHLGGP